MIKTDLCKQNWMAIYVNDLQTDMPIDYQITELATGKVLTGSGIFAANTSEKLLELPQSLERSWLVFQWSYNGETQTNHFVSRIKGMDYRQYTDFIKYLGYDVYEGFV